MKWHYMILCFLVMFYNSEKLLAQEDLMSFHGLQTGMSLEQVKKLLSEKKSFLKTETASYYHEAISIYDILGITDHPYKNYIDSKNLRIYYDDEVFFDLRKFSITNREYSFFYRDNYYFLESKNIVSYQVGYASRINGLLYDLWLKFFNEKLYSIEYKAMLSPVDIIKLKNNYLDRYGRILTEGTQVVEKENVLSIIELDNSTVTITRVDKKLRNGIFDYINTMSGEVVNTAYQHISALIPELKDAKQQILLQKKNYLQKKLTDNSFLINAL